MLYVFHLQKKRLWVDFFFFQSYLMYFDFFTLTGRFIREPEDIYGAFPLQATARLDFGGFSTVYSIWYFFQYHIAV